MRRLPKLSCVFSTSFPPNKLILHPPPALPFVLASMSDFSREKRNALRRRTIFSSLLVFDLTGFSSQMGGFRIRAVRELEIAHEGKDQCGSCAVRMLIRKRCGEPCPLQSSPQVLKKSS